MPPEKVAKWEGVRTALTYSYISPQALSDKIDDVGEFLTPHRYGNPNHKGLPNWPAYTRANGAAMILDNTCVVRNHHDKELMSLLAPEIKF
jgi:carboxylesterase type B